MNNKLVVGLVITAIMALAIAWAAAPVFAAQALIRAAKAGDADRIEQLVDFPALRQSLKDELTSEVAAEMRRDPRLADSTLGGLGMMLAPMLLSGAIDATVTPEVVARMVTTAEAPDPTVRDQPEPGDAADSDDIHQAWGYRDLNAFAVTLTDRDHPDQRLALILERRGPFTWKLAAVDIQRGGSA
ncbi:DUF2939 domain-containing protein [Brevundimonas basaltis]|uniref:DUF2939 domain-containing protein n=1 Tax=Brevundimonas basaltis TaxID=472166 RepID=A0A7W8HZD6_9CAUL|nr:DUF2939 domain-containing protein [Brevundimonas basaltis]MBB5292610.1 hypothetical protein [Brevundimonas basaltis]